MPETLTIFAPGKLMLAGEYSVLAPGGGRALALAVDRGVLIESIPSTTWHIERADGSASWHDDHDRTVVPQGLRFAVEGWRLSLAALHASPPAPRRMTTHTRGARTGRAKPGVGGSASVTVATCATLFEAAGQSLDRARPRVLEIALDAHLSAQMGRGSGYDVATSVLGGLVETRRDETGAVHARRLEWPDDVYAIAGYSGNSADTRALLARLQAARDAKPQLVAQALDTLARPVSALATSLQNVGAPAKSNDDELQQHLAACHQALCRFDQLLTIGIITDAIESMVAIAHALGLSAKVSGAGGGDSLIALSDDPSRLERLAIAWREAGFVPFDVTIHDQGVCREALPESHRR